MTPPPPHPVAPGKPRPQSCRPEGSAAIAAYLILFAAFQAGVLFAFIERTVELEPAAPPIPWLACLLWLVPAADALRRAADLIIGGRSD